MSALLRPFGTLALASLLVAPMLACEPDPDDGPGWSFVFEDLDPALLSLWGSGHDDIYAVGADAGDGPMVLHFDGEGWTRMATGESGNLWWVSGNAEQVWMSGEGGLILRHDRATSTIERTPTPADTVTIFGIQPFASDDVWAVGGDVQANTGVVWHWDGAAWTEDASATTMANDAAAGSLFKVWGSSGDELWVVGLGGVGLRYTGGAWSTVPIPTGRRLFTVHGAGEHIVAVGGYIDGLIVSWDGQQWVDETPAGVPQLNGVWVSPDGSAVAVGIQGSIWERRDGAWSEVSDTPSSLWDYHSAYVDPEGDIWAVGGVVVSEPYDRGMLAHYGVPVSTTIE